MSLMTSNWDYLGSQRYKKFEICRMLWTSNIEEYNIYCAPYGGPIALTPKKHLAKKLSGTIVSIYSALGDQLSSFLVQDRIVSMGWTHQEELICVHPKGFVSLYGLFGQHLSTLTLDQEIRDAKIIDSKVFCSSGRTGIAILTSLLSFYLYNNVHELKLRRLAQIPNFNEPPLCWDIIAFDVDTKIVVSNQQELVILKSQDLSCKIINPFSEEKRQSVVSMGVSFDYTHIALFTEFGELYLCRTNDDISYCYSMFDTESKVKPRQLAWCGNEAVAGHWVNLIFFVDLQKNWLKYPTFNMVHMVQEIDCIRVVDDNSHEMIKKVENVENEIFKIGSWSSGANLLEASRLYERQDHKVDDYIRIIQEKDEMVESVKMCLEAACHEFNIATQKMLLRAASFGKCFTSDMSPNRFVEVCQKLRILNVIRKANVGVPLTYEQLENLTIAVLIDRLIERRQFLLALKIADYLKLPAEEGSIKVLTQWAFFKIRQQEILNEEQIAEDIARKIPADSGVSYAEIANKAIEYGRKSLAIKLLDYEMNATNQVPLLLKLKEYRSALQKAIESGNPNLIYIAILGFKKVQSLDQFYLGLRDYPVAYALYQKYCKQDDPQQLRNIYFQENDHISEGVSYLEQSLKIDSSESTWRKNKLSLISSALDTFKKSRNEFLSSHSDEYFRLMKHQLKCEDKYQGVKFFDLSLQQTMKILLENHDQKTCDELKREFKVPDKRFWFLKIQTLAEMNEWNEIEKLSKSKKSPIGYEPFVDVCIKHNNRIEAQKYLPKIRDEFKVKYLIRTGNLEEASKVAFEKKDLDGLRVIQSNCGSINPSLREKVTTMINKLQ